MKWIIKCDLAPMYFAGWHDNRLRGIAHWSAKRSSAVVYTSKDDADRDISFWAKKWRKSPGVNMRLVRLVPKKKAP